MTDHYKQMMHYLYDAGTERGLFDIEMSNQEIDRRKAKLKEELDFMQQHRFTDYLNLAFPKRKLVKIHPETLKRCEVSING